MALGHWILRGVRSSGGGLLGLFLRQPASPWVPIALYGPVALLCLGWNLLGERTPLWALLVLPPAGFLLWTFLEYLLHCGAFHAPTHSPGLLAVQASHRSHHADPKDPHRIVARPAISLSAALVLFAVFCIVLEDVRLGALVLSGLIPGYLAYEVVHYWIHRGRWGRRLLRPLIRHHLYHHHKDSSRCYGVTSPLWDWVFRTGRPRTASAQD